MEDEPKVKHVEMELTVGDRIKHLKSQREACSEHIAHLRTSLRIEEAKLSKIEDQMRDIVGLPIRLDPQAQYQNSLQGLNAQAGRALSNTKASYLGMR